MLGQRGQEAHQGAGFDQPRTRHVGDHHPAGAHGLQHARHAQARGAVQLQRIDEVRVHAAPDHIGPLQTGDGAHIGLAVAHHQIIALDQQETQVAGQVRLFEIGLAERARRQQADARVRPVRRGRQASAEVGEERRQPLDVHGVVEIGEGAREHHAVLQRVAGAGRGLGAVVEHPPATVRAAPQIGGVKVHRPSAGQGDTAHGAHEVVAAGDRRGGQMSLADQPRLAIEVVQHRLEQGRALGHAGGDARPFRLAEDQRQRAERPGAFGVVAVDAMGDARVADMSGGQGEPVLELAFGKLGHRAQEPQPGGRRGPAGGLQLIRGVGQRPVAVQPAAQAIGGEAARALAFKRGGEVNGQGASSNPGSRETRRSGAARECPPRPGCDRAAGNGRGGAPGPRRR